MQLGNSPEKIDNRPKIGGNVQSNVLIDPQKVPRKSHLGNGRRLEFVVFALSSEENV